MARIYHTLSKVGTWVINQADSRALTYDTAWNLLAERTRNGTQEGEYIHGQRTDEVLVSNLKSQQIYPLADGLGSVVALASDNGKVVERFRYSALWPSHELVSNLSGRCLVGLRLSPPVYRSGVVDSNFTERTS